MDSEIKADVRLAVLETQREAHQERHTRYEDMVGKHIESMDTRLLGISRHLERVETKVDAMTPSNGRWDPAKRMAVQGVGGVGGGAGILAVIKIAEMLTKAGS